MPLDKESLEALTKALSDGVNERVTNTLEQFSKSQAENLKDGLNGIMTNMLKAQDAFEVKTDLKIDSLGETLSKRQDKSEQENPAKFADISKQILVLLSSHISLLLNQNPSVCHLPPVSPPLPTNLRPTLETLLPSKISLAKLGP